MPFSYAEIFESLPPELRLPIARLVDAFREEFGVSRSDFEELKGSVRELAEAQKRTELQVEKLTQAQLQTEIRLSRLEESVQRLAEAQKQTELQMTKLAAAVEDLTQAHTQFRRTFDMQIGALGARWGLHAEEAFRQGMRGILQEVGFTTERFLEYDEEGRVFGRPDQVELDVVVKDGKLIVVEIKSSLDRGGAHLFHNKVNFYARKTGQRVDRKMIIAPHVEEGVKELAAALGIELFTDITELR